MTKISNKYHTTKKVLKIVFLIFFHMYLKLILHKVNDDIET